MGSPCIAGLQSSSLGGHFVNRHGKDTGGPTGGMRPSLPDGRGKPISFGQDNGALGTRRLLALVLLRYLIRNLEGTTGEP